MNLREKAILRDRIRHMLELDLVSGERFYYPFCSVDIIDALKSETGIEYPKNTVTRVLKTFGMRETKADNNTTYFSMLEEGEDFNGVL